MIRSRMMTTPEPRAHLHIRLHQDTLRKVAELARESQRSMAAQIGVMIEHYVRLLEQRQQ